MKIQCKVCIESPIVDIPAIDTAYDDDMICCPNCEKWIATAYNNKYHKYWAIEDDTHKLEDGKIIKDYPVKIIN